jgi:hypothetical protein
MKTCFKCGTSKPLTDYYKHPQMGDGHLNKCKECARKDSADRLEIKTQDPEWVEKEKLRHVEKFRRYRNGTELEIKKIKARSAVKHAISKNEIQKEPCAVCGNHKVQGHHEDYDKPLDITWLCIRHHNDRHVHLTDCANLNQKQLSIKKFIQKLKENKFR